MDLQPAPNSYDRFSFREKHTHRYDVIEGAILLIGGFLVVMLGLRFLFALLGANEANEIASFVYGFIGPLTAPFYNLFSYDHPAIGISTIEGYTIVTMLVYGAITVGLAKLVSLFRYF